MAEKGNDKTIWWIAGSMFTVIMFLVGVILMGYDSRMDVIEDFHITGEQRLTKLETEAKHINEQLDKMDSKLDYLVEKKAGGG